MTKELKDYLPFYLGGECVSDSMFSGVLQLRSVGLYGFHASNDETTVHGSHEHIKLLLRPLSVMTSTEETEMKSLMGRQTDGVHPVYILVHSSYSFAYLLKQGFDLFGLIEAGLAIDKTKMQ